MLLKPVLVSSALRGVAPSFDCGVLKTFQGKSINGLTPFISGVLKWRAPASGENTPLSKSGTPPTQDVDISGGLKVEKAGVMSTVQEAEEDGSVAFEVAWEHGVWVLGCTGVPACGCTGVPPRCGVTKL